ncbi:MAG: DUF952 domain-containing protein [Chitinophagaceae bacterium]
MENIYHITTINEWEVAKRDGFYVAASLPIEGFIHCSKAEQVEGVLERYYKGVTGLVKLVIDVSKLNHKLIYELAPSINQEFPHIYGSINIDAVVNVIILN